MKTRAIEALSRGLSGRTESFFSTNPPSPTNIDAYIPRQQFERFTHDIGMWRDSVYEAELAFRPARTRMQRMYMDAASSPHIIAIIERWKELTLQRKREIWMPSSGGGSLQKSDYLTDHLADNSWFHSYMEGVIMATKYGYSFIALGNIVDDKFPSLKEIRREHVNPDGTGNGPTLNKMIYSINGVEILDDPLIEMCNHYIPTRPWGRASNCGYGDFLYASFYDIHLRNLLGWNLDYAESFGMPIKKGSTNKIDKERKKFEDFLANGASSAYILLDKNSGDEIEFVQAQNAGTAWKVYGDAADRIEGKLAQIILGHEDVMKSTPGKLGGMQKGNKDGEDMNFIQQALNSKQATIGTFVENTIHDISAPLFRKLGKYVGSKNISELFPLGSRIKLLNDAEENEVKNRDLNFKKKYADIASVFNTAGYDVDAEEFSTFTGMKLTRIDPRTESFQERKNTTTIIKENPDGTPVTETGE